MNSIFTNFGKSILVTLIAISAPGFSQPIAEKGTERIGVYDSRAIAIAYAGSPFQAEKMSGLMAKHKKAKDAGDATEISRLEAEGRAWQKSLHEQGFGTAPVDNILAYVAGDLPKIKEAAAVTTLISKWNKAELAKYPKAMQVDVTMRLVDAFHPVESQRKHAIEIQRQKPN